MMELFSILTIQKVRVYNTYVKFLQKEILIIYD